MITIDLKAWFIMKIAIWGLGIIYEKYRNKISDDIVCIVDNTCKDKSIYQKIDVISPDKLSEYEYEYIVIFSSKFYDEISYQLVMELGMDCKKILKWEYYLGEDYYNFSDISNMIYTYCKFTNTREILDIGGIVADKQLFKLKEIYNVDLLYYLDKNIFTKGYNNVYKLCEEIDKKYDLLLINKVYLQDFLLEQFISYADNILFIIPFADFKNIKTYQNKRWNVVNLKGYLFGYIKKDDSIIKIFEVTHKEFIPIKDDNYLPIHAGSILSPTLKYQRDDIGDHISNLNLILNECTALYWIWKNANYEILGLNHYRRFFRSKVNNYMIQEWEIQLFFQQYDIIVAESHCTIKHTIAEELQKAVCKEAFSKTMKHLKDIFDTKGEEEKKAFLYVFQGHIMYPCNMFITYKKILDEYCDWLFPILFKLIERITIDEAWDNYSKRVIGFFAERLFTVWLVQQKYKIMELPILLVGNGKPFGK